MLSMVCGKLGAAVVGVGVALGLAAPSLLAQSIDAETIVRALTPPPKGPLTRSFGQKPSRGISIEGGDVRDDPAPSIDLYVHFEFDQSALTMSDAQLAVDTLGRALKDPRLASMRFEIIGHTDARGTDEYNLGLSRRRAEAVRSRLVQFHGIDPARLFAEGRGRRELKDPSRPEDGINRRVQIRTVTDKTS
jgi:outer membrane protein OmpA-like peptidoglycan-associated protein